jgi:putative flippase GtrA
MITEMYGRFRHLIHEGGKFLVVGGVGTVVTFGVANGLHGIGHYKAITVATVVATIVTYLGNRYWTFKHREGKGTTRDTVLFFVLNGIGLLIYYACIGLVAVTGLDPSGGKTSKDLFWYNVALVVGTGLGTLFRFWSYRRWVWTMPGASGSPAASTFGELAEPHPHPHHHGHGTDGPPPQESLTPQTTGRAHSRPVGAHRRP